MNGQMYSVLAHQPMTVFWIVFAFTFVLGGVLGWAITFLTRKLGWRKWLPRKYYNRMMQLNTDLKCALYERNWYQDRYVAVKATLKAITSLATSQEIADGEEVTFRESSVPAFIEDNGQDSEGRASKD